MKNLLLAAAFAAIVLVHPIAYPQKSTSSSEWRTSFPVFAEEAFRYGKTVKETPTLPPEFVEKGGEMSPTSEVMKLFSGPVEWECNFLGFADAHKLAGRTHKVNLGCLPAGIHVYPSQDSVESWERLAPKSTVRFTGTIEGVVAVFRKVEGGTLGTIIVSIRDARPVKAK